MNRNIHLMLVDDEPVIQQGIVNNLMQYENITVCAKAFSIQEAKLRLSTMSVDAVFLDVELGNESGFELAAYIRENYPEIAIIFITGHMELAINGYDYEPLDYLVKPIDGMRLQRAVERLEKAFLVQKASEPAKEEILIETTTGSFFIPVEDILYCELRNRRVYVGQRSGTEICCSLSLGKVESLLKEHGFLKVYQSVLVRQSEIASVEKDIRGQTYQVKLRTNGLIFPASRKIFYEAKKLTREQ